jgi:hypothetical protein
LLLNKNPAAGPGAQQAVGAAVGSIAQGAAEGDTRLQQALDLLKENKIAKATPLLKAVAKDKTARPRLVRRANREARAINMAAIRAPRFRAVSRGASTRRLGEAKAG